MPDKATCIKCRKTEPHDHNAELGDGVTYSWEAGMQRAEELLAQLAKTRGATWVIERLGLFISDTLRPLMKRQDDERKANNPHLLDTAAHDPFWRPNEPISSLSQEGENHD